MQDLNQKSFLVYETNAIDKIAQYLSERPYKEVLGFIHTLQSARLIVNEEEIEKVEFEKIQKPESPAAKEEPDQEKSISELSNKTKKEIK